LPPRISAAQPKYGEATSRVASFSARFGERRLNCTPSSDQVNQQNDEREHQQQVDESTHRVTGYQTQQPKNQKNYEDCPQHGCFLPYLGIEIRLLLKTIGNGHTSRIT
jgi:hypothetical protein